MKRKAAARLADLEQRLASKVNARPLIDRIRSWRLHELLAELEAMKHGEPKVVWPKLPPDVAAHERREALAIAAELDREDAEFPQKYPEYMAVIQGRHDWGGENDTDT
ncbi:MAG: hypothetical protein K2X38_24000 [Gemmataceae bacterium]|nr:hypothetical protein [Gemmataceae bacterium]